MNQDSSLDPALEQPLRSSIEALFREYETSFEDMESIQLRQAKARRNLSAAYQLYYEVTGSRHPSQETYIEIASRERNMAQTDQRHRVTLSDSLVVVGQASAERQGTLVPSASLGSRPPANLQEMGETQMPKPVMPPRSGRLKQIYDVLSLVTRPMSSKEIGKILTENGHFEGVENPAPAVAANLSRGRKLGVFERVGRGYYTISDRVIR